MNELFAVLNPIFFLSLLVFLEYITEKTQLVSKMSPFMKTENMFAMKETGETRLNLIWYRLLWPTRNIGFINGSFKKIHVKGRR
jgi:hypothetical protein